MKDHQLVTFPNGIRLVYKEVPNTKIIHGGFVLDIGSRDENSDQQGLAHFWEHMAFKGTSRRRAFHILNRLDSLGGELNAYTTKENICFYASILDKHFEKALELLTDITFDSVFPESQIERERQVILEEMAMYKDSPEDSIQDDFDDLVFAGHSMAHNILGTSESIRRFSRSDFKQFIGQNLNTERLVFSCVGGLPFGKVVKLAEKYLSEIPHITSDHRRTPFYGYKPKTSHQVRDLAQAHCAMGQMAYPLGNKRRLPFYMLTNYLGGPSLNSRLNLALREKHGFVYAIDANYLPFTDIGLFAIFFGTQNGKMRQSQELVLKELRKLKDKPLGKTQLHKLKEQLIGQLAMAEENNISLMLMMGKSILNLGRIDSLDDIFRKINDTDAIELQEIAIEIFAEEHISYITYGPN